VRRVDAPAPENHGLEVGVPIAVSVDHPVRANAQALGAGVAPWSPGAARHAGEGSMNRLILALLAALLMGCAAGQRDAAREAWDAHDVQRARECRGAAITGTCIGGGGP
jgi:hypothetical protein